MACPAKERVRLAERAWSRHTMTLAPPEPWFDVVEEFVGDVKPKNPELSCAALLLPLELARSWDSFIEGGWIRLASVHVYCYGEGRGLGPMFVLRTIERFARWMGARGGIVRWDEKRLLHIVDQERRANGGTPRGAAAAHDTPVPRPDVRGRVLEQFASSSHARGLPEPLLGPALQLAAIPSTAPRTQVVRFGALDPYELLLLMGDSADVVGDSDPDELAAFDLVIYRILVAFYRWLGDTGRLEPSRADEIARGLERILTMPHPGAEAVTS